MSHLQGIPITGRCPQFFSTGPGTTKRYLRTRPVHPLDWLSPLFRIGYDKGRYHIRNMAGELVTKTDESLTASGSAAVPSVVMAAGKKAGLRFIEFFTANIRNPNTRRAYHRACCDFFRWCESRGLELEEIGPGRVAGASRSASRRG